MKKTLHYFSSLTDKLPKEVAWEAVATEIRSGQLTAQTAKYRTYKAHEAETHRQGDSPNFLTDDTCHLPTAVLAPCNTCNRYIFRKIREKKINSLYSKLIY